jgi:rare lipoprotein A
MTCAKAKLFFLPCSRSLFASKYTIAVFCACLILSACSSKPTGRYSIEQDIAPDFDYGEIEYQYVTPTRETYNKWTAKPYSIAGIPYVPMLSARGFEDEGQASWYGQKFHGHKTANGEIFDMFALTAAHKTLPLPSYVKVTNLQNDKHVIVRVNDRGPFHGNRILDLSYGAAKKLGYHSNGVTEIKMEVVYVEENGDIKLGKDDTVYEHKNGKLLAKAKPKPRPVLSAQTSTSSDKPILANDTVIPGMFVQVMAMQNGEKAKSLAQGLSNLLQVPNNVPKVANVYRLQLGPLESEQKVKNVIKELKKIGFGQAFKVEVTL